jgi:hypothetical protein
MKNWLFTFLLLIGLTLIGCSNSTKGMDMEKPPKAEIEVGSNSYETILGTYCWRGDGQGRCVDTAGPEELLKGKEPIKVKPGEKITFVMNYEPKPNKFHVLQISESKEVEVSLKNNSFTAPIQKGVYYYSYGVWWMDDKEENLSHGDAFYNFVIEVE